MDSRKNRQAKSSTNWAFFTIHQKNYTKRKGSLCAMSRMIEKIVRTRRVGHWSSRRNAGRPCLTLECIGLWIPNCSTRQKGLQLILLIRTSGSHDDHSQSLFGCTRRIHELASSTFLCNRYNDKTTLLKNTRIANKSLFQTFIVLDWDLIDATTNGSVRSRGILEQSRNHIGNSAPSVCYFASRTL